jgi:hypothetical protein
MATEGPFLNDGSQTTAAADLSAKQFYIVKLTGSRQVNLCSANTDKAYGVLQNKPKSGDAADIVVLGICKVLCNSGAGITAGVQFMPNTDGTAIAFTTPGTNTPVGIALETVAANQVFTAFIGRVGP